MIIDGFEIFLMNSVKPIGTDSKVYLYLHILLLKKSTRNTSLQATWDKLQRQMLLKFFPNLRLKICIHLPRKKQKMYWSNWCYVSLISCLIFLGSEHNLLVKKEQSAHSRMPYKCPPGVKCSISCPLPVLSSSQMRVSSRLVT